MIKVFSIEIWVAILFFLNFFLFIFVFVLVKKINQLKSFYADAHVHDTEQDDSKNVDACTTDIVDVLVPLVEESRQAAISFERLLNEKRQLSKDLNEMLDSRISRIKRFLSHADALQKKLEIRHSMLSSTNLSYNDSLFNTETSSNSMLSHQHKIIEMYQQQFDIDSIAQKLSIPRGEVQLVIELKKKFVEMEKNNK